MAATEYDPFYGERRNAVFDPVTRSFTDLQNMGTGGGIPGHHARRRPRDDFLGTGGYRRHEQHGRDLHGRLWVSPGTRRVDSSAYPRMHLSTDAESFMPARGRAPGSSVPSTILDGVVANTKYTGSRGYGTRSCSIDAGERLQTAVMILGGASPQRHHGIIALRSTPVWSTDLRCPSADPDERDDPADEGAGTRGSKNTRMGVPQRELERRSYDPNTNTSVRGPERERAPLPPPRCPGGCPVLLIGGNLTRQLRANPGNLFARLPVQRRRSHACTRPTVTGVTPARWATAPRSRADAPPRPRSRRRVVRPGAATHALTWNSGSSACPHAGSGVLHVTAPPNGNIARRLLLLFVLNTAGVRGRQVRAADLTRQSTPVATLTVPRRMSHETPEASCPSRNRSDPDGSVGAMRGHSLAAVRVERRGALAM